MKSPRFLAIVAFALAAVLLFARLGGLSLTDPDEGRNASVAREMLVRGDWLVPTYNGVPYLDKPALFFRMVAGSIAMLGTNEAAARLPSALCAMALLGLVFVFCRREFGGRTAALAVAVTGSAPLFFGFGRTVIFDMPLALAVSAAVLAAYRAEHGPETGAPPAYAWWWGGPWHATAAVATAVAVLLKGPVGVIVPGLVTIVVHLLQPRALRRPGFVRRLFAPLNVGIFFALTLAWFLGVCHRQPDFAHYGLVEETVRRYTTTSFHRTAPWWYYGPVLLGTFFPWSALLPEGIAAAWRRRRALAPADRFLMAWALVVVAFFSTSQSKLPGYILPSVAPLGILVARVFSGAFAAGADAPRWRALVLRATLILAVLSAAAAAFLGFVSIDTETARRVFRIRGADFDRLLPAFPPTAWTLAAVAAAAVTARFTRRTALALAVFLVFPLSVITVDFGAIRESIEAGSSRGLAAQVPGGADVACLECFPNGLPFYLGREVTLVTRDGRELTSNYALYKLRQGGSWPSNLVPAAERNRWLAARPRPVFLLSRKNGRAALDSLAAARGAEVRVLRPGWWGALLPAAGPVPAGAR